MSWLNAVSERLARSDMVQLVALAFVALTLTIGFSWPSGGRVVNESWYSVAPVRTTMLALLALGFALAQGPFSNGSSWRHEARVSLVALLTLTLLTAPFEVVSRAASYPAVDQWWSLAVPLLVVPAYFGLGLVLARVTSRWRLGWSLPLLVPAVLVGLVWLDLKLNRTLFNPWAAPLALSWGFAAVMGAATLATTLWLAASTAKREVRT